MTSGIRIFLIVVALWGGIGLGVMAIGCLFVAALNREIKPYRVGDRYWR